MNILDIIIWLVLAVAVFNGWRKGLIGKLFSLGGLIGAIGGLGAAAAYNLRSDKKGTELAWSDKAVSSFILEAVLLYLAVAHFGRGRGEWAESESPAFWKEAE